MNEAPVAPVGRECGRRRAPRGAPTFAALDLGTNNCRLLIAAPAAGGFRIVDAFSRIIRLGEGLSASGRLGEAAMERAFAALGVCAEKIERRGVRKVSAVATQACRSASNGAEFLAEVERRTGLTLAVISPREEARLSVEGCLNLLDYSAQAALVVDVGGGSTELSWLDLSGGAEGRAHTAPSGRPGQDEQPRRPPLCAWLSIPIGVVTLAERFPEDRRQGEAWFRAMVVAMRERLDAFTRADGLRPAFAAGAAHLVGTSGAITSLAGVHLGLPRYDRSRVDGLWMTRAECESVTGRLAQLTVAQRASEPCIGPDRADLVLAGAAILAAVQESWPCERVRVADRGLREGLLLSLMATRARAIGRRGGNPGVVA